MEFFLLDIIPFTPPTFPIDVLTDVPFFDKCGATVEKLPDVKIEEFSGIGMTAGYKSSMSTKLKQYGGTYTIGGRVTSITRYCINKERYNIISKK